MTGGLPPFRFPSGDLKRDFCQLLDFHYNVYACGDIELFESG